jgi:formate dehydrogenase major subunit
MGYEPQADFGTPEVQSETAVTLTIDGRTVMVPAGTSVLRAAAMSGGSIPSLCATDSVKAFGSCRLCLVEVDGMRGTPASCTTPVAEGMIVHTQTERLARLRKGVMELYISDHPLDCLTCSANNDCELQDTAAKWACAMSAMAMRARTIWARQPTARTPISILIPANASPVRAASALVTRFRVHWR